MRRYAKVTRLIILIIAIGTLLALSACTKSNTESSPNSAESSSSPAPSESEKPGESTERWKQKFDPPVTITTAIIDDGTSRGMRSRPGRQWRTTRISAG